MPETGEIRSTLLELSAIANPNFSIDQHETCCTTKANRLDEYLANTQGCSEILALDQKAQKTP